MAFEKILRWIDDFLLALNSSLKQPVGAYCRLQTTDTEYSLVADDGSLVSILFLHGNFQAVDEGQGRRIIDEMSTALTPVFAHEGHALQVVFSYDPTGGKHEVFRSLEPTRITARNLGLDIDEVLVNWGEAVSGYVAEESVFLVLWTRPAVLVPSVRKKAREEMSQAVATGPVVGPDVQNVGKLMHALQNKHHQYVQGIASVLRRIGMSFELLEAHDMVRKAREEADPEFTGTEWGALLPGDKLPLSYPDPGETGMDNLLYPALSRQIFPREAEEFDRRTIRIGDRLHSPLSVELMPEQPKPFNTLFSSLIEKTIPGG